MTTGTSVAAAIAGTGASGTAPTFDLPTTVGLSVVVTDQYAAPDQYYKFLAGVDGSYRLELWMDQGDGCVADLDFITTAGNSGTCSHPEAVNAAGVLAAATITTRVNYYSGPISAWIQVIVRKTN